MYKKIIKNVFKNETAYFHINAPGCFLVSEWVSQKGTVGSDCCILGNFFLFGESWQFTQSEIGQKEKAGIFLVELLTLGSSFIVPRFCGIPNCLKEACSLSLPSAGYIFVQNALCSQALLHLCLICTDPPLCLIGSFLYETISNLDISLFVSLVPPCHLSGWSGGVPTGHRSWDIPLFLKTSWGVSHGKGLGVQFLPA